MQEMGTYIDQDVRGKLNGMCGMLRVYIGSLSTNFQEKKQELDQCIRDVANAVDGRLIENNKRNNRESLLEELIDAIMGSREEMKESRNNTQQIQENEWEWGKIEEDKNWVSGEMKRRIDSVKTQEDRQQDGIRYDQTKVPKSSSVWGKVEVKVEVPPPD